MLSRAECCSLFQNDSLFPVPYGGKGYSFDSYCENLILSILVSLEFKPHDMGDPKALSPTLGKSILS